MTVHHGFEHSRRAFLSEMAALAGAAIAGKYSGYSVTWAQGASRLPVRWTDRMGLQTFTVRDRMSVDFEGTLAAIAAAGYTEVEFAGSLGDRTPRQVRGALDKAGLAAVSTHIAVTAGPDLEKQLEAYQIIGHRYTAVGTNAPAAGGGGRRGAGAAAPPPPNLPDTWKRRAQLLNEAGAAGKKYGIRALVHNHVDEFAPLQGAAGTGYDILLAETDPNMVSMELDIGWAAIAGQDPETMFRAHPGRFDLWHVKDTTGLAAAVARPLAERSLGANFVPVGAGDIDYKKVFAAASAAGLQHFFVEQDNASDGDSLAAIRTSARNLKRLLA